jgi:proteic killer suppression protein
VREFGTDVARRYIERINVIKSARSVSEILALPGLHGHELKGERAGQYAIRLTGYVRLIFTVQGDDPRVICVEEVSKHYEE